MLIDIKITKRIAHLAKIELNEKEIEEYSKDLSNILSWMDELKKVDVKGIEPVTSVNDNKLFEREDLEFEDKIKKEEILLNAPDKNEDYFIVPKVIE
ncbi:Asp-tRNA(Asn)/Glu-tRNA(Gln) amidotransferase subunit GatC [Pelagibacteraceae bacterium]|nr:Asp-tRNA(Asn)/Glu-tRNA(Gln) amidotransferase subunit GatC [Pelagibacteraceae bacterium]